MRANLQVYSSTCSGDMEGIAKFQKSRSFWELLFKRVYDINVDIHAIHSRPLWHNFAFFSVNAPCSSHCVS